MNEFKAGDWVQRKEGFIDGCWLRKTKDRARYPHRIKEIKRVTGFLFLDGLPFSWGPSLFNKASPPKLEFNESDYL